MMEVFARKSKLWALLSNIRRREKARKTFDEVVFLFFKRATIAGTLFLAGLTAYHYFFNDEVETHHRPSPLFDRCAREIPELRGGKFRATFYMPFRWMQIIQGNRFENCYCVSYEREVIRARDGEQIVLDWVPALPAAQTGAEPVVVVLAGATATSSCSYVKAQVLGLRAKGFRVVALNQRGSILPQITTKIFNMSHLQHDLNDAVAHIHAQLPRSNLYLMGFSMGASVALRFAATSPQAHLVKGVATVGNPFDFYKAAQTTYQLKNAVYGNFLLKKIRQRILYNGDAIKRFEAESGVTFDMPAIIKARTAFAVDDMFSKYVYSDFKSAEEYYSLVSCLPFVAQVKAPVLVIHSKDDPICEFKHVPVELLKTLPNYFLAFTPKGGHVEFFVGKKMKRWNVQPVAEFLRIVEEEQNGKRIKY